METLARAYRITVLGFLVALAACAPEGTPAPAPTEVLAVDTPPPDYPLELACDDIGGEVVLRVTVGADGVPSAIDVHRSSRAPALDAAAVDAVRGWRFRPATRGGEPVARTIQVPVTFNPPTERPDACFVLDERRSRNQL